METPTVKGEATNGLETYAAYVDGISGSGKSDLLAAMPPFWNAYDLDDFGYWQGNQWLTAIEPLRWRMQHMPMPGSITALEHAEPVLVAGTSDSTDDILALPWTDIGTLITPWGRYTKFDHSVSPFAATDRESYIERTLQIVKNLTQRRPSAVTMLAKGGLLRDKTLAVMTEPDGIPSYLLTAISPSETHQLVDAAASDPIEFRAAWEAFDD
jgi:hypothetical protein